MHPLIPIDMLAFLDRGNIGNARIAGLQEDFQLGGNRYQWLINIFYIAYVLAEFGILLWKVFPPHIVGAIVVFGWYVGTHHVIAILSTLVLLLTLVKKGLNRHRAGWRPGVGRAYGVEVFARRLRSLLRVRHKSTTDFALLPASNPSP